MLQKVGIVVAALLAAGAVVWGVVALTDGDHDMSGMGAMQGMDHGGMTVMGAVPFDQQFIDDMVPHHQMAVQMAQIVIDRGRRPELRAMADTIIATQTAEIDQMKTWRKEWFDSAATPMMPSHEMAGMDIAAIRAAADVDRAFLQEMILHHRSAVQMAERARQRAEHDEIRDLARRIIAAQEGEIVQMRAWQAAWYG